MKRVRVTSPPPRNMRPAVAPATAAGTDQRRLLRTEDALQFMLSVRRTLEPAMYQEFLDAVSQSQLHSIGVRGLADRVKVLFRGHPELKRQFNTFVPAQYNISLSDDDDQQ